MTESLPAAKPTAEEILDSAVTSPDGVTWDFLCPVASGCGEPGGRGFLSTGWPTQEIAKDRGKYHFDEHKFQVPGPSLDEFRAKHGLVVAADGSVSVGDL